MQEPAKGPLAGIRIVEFIGLGPAPFAAMQFADMGADVIRIARPGATPALPDPISGRGRPTVEADLKSPGDVEAVRKLVDHADALIEGFRPGVMERLGLGPEPLFERNPRLVYGRMTGWGQSGPLSAQAGHDINFIAITGALAAIGPAERPLPPLNLVGDFGGGAMFLVSGMLAALVCAQRNGTGQVVDSAICDGTIQLMTMAHDMAAAGHWRAEREANLLDGGAPYYGTYECADGVHIAVGPIEPQFFELFREAIGLSEDAHLLRADPRNWPALRDNIATLIRTRKSTEWLALLEHSDACVSPVLDLYEAAEHPHLVARQSFVELDGITQPAPAPRFSATPTQARARPRDLLSLADAIQAWTGK
ncbi:CaiB/BaiF CoA-transferase family protein [Aminobacter sp. AP02]|uniref:CaiB/BaiF CoA transferase family protein n=1 Tax=Aminobacter sp. AP02 TaxID=2135737 RepID=UPI000D79F633|nr:CaiB/BaiF CoA-transferase family protein [Aminobacter sp. AP02]PWK76307.1 alpha-methylacyl-CoA racemase [Aminobacter sp. AP02]